MIGVRWVGYPAGRCRHAVLATEHEPLCGWPAGARNPWHEPTDYELRWGRYRDACVPCTSRLAAIERSEAELDARLAHIVVLRQAVAETIVEDIATASNVGHRYLARQEQRLAAWLRLGREAAALRGER